MLKKNKFLIGIIATTIIITNLGVPKVGAKNHTEHSNAYKKRISQLKNIENIYVNKDGKIGGVFKLEDGTTTRIVGVSENGTVYVRYKKKIMPYSNSEMDIFIQRSTGD